MTREFTTKNEQGEEIVLVIREPNYGINRKCDLEAKKAWAECLAMGVKTEDVLQKTLKEQGLWTDKEEAQVKSLQTKVAVHLTLLEEYRSQKKTEEAKQAALSACNLRNELHELLAIKNKTFSYSCEGISSEVRVESFIAFATVYKEDPTRTYWANYQDFVARRDEAAATDAIDRYSELAIQENLNSLKELPENVFLV